MLNTSILIAFIQMSANENNNAFISAFTAIPSIHFLKFSRSVQSKFLFHLWLRSICICGMICLKFILLL